jgi:RimJ/RimL family protein N-acetyltransferase
MMANSKSPLTLRPWRPSDVASLREAIDEDVGHLRPWLGWARHEPSAVDETEALVRSWIRDYESGDGLRFAIVSSEDPELILGGAGLNRRLGPTEYTLGYWVRKSATRRGIASAATAAVVCHAFNRLGLDRVLAEFDEGNEASMAVAEALGFTWVGRFTGRYGDGSPRPVVRFGLNRGGIGGQYWRLLQSLADGVTVITSAPGTDSPDEPTSMTWGCG